MGAPTENMQFFQILIDTLGPFGALLVAFLFTFNKGMVIVDRIIASYEARTLAIREIAVSLTSLTLALNRFEESKEAKDSNQLIVSLAQKVLDENVNSVNKRKREAS